MEPMYELNPLPLASDTLLERNHPFRYHECMSAKQEAAAPSGSETESAPLPSGGDTASAPPPSGGETESAPLPSGGDARPLSGRRAQAARNDERILDAAREVFLADPGAPISAVAEHAG